MQLKLIQVPQFDNGEGVTTLTFLEDQIKCISSASLCVYLSCKKCFPFYQIIWNLFVCPSSWYFLWVWLVICVPTWHLRLGKCIHMCDQKAATANPRYTSSIHGPVITSARTPVLIISAGCLSVFWIFLRNSSSLSFFLKILFRQKNVLNSRHGSLRLLSVTPGYFDDEFH